MPEQVKDIVFIILGIIFLFCTLYLGAWFLNGYYTTHFDLPALLALLKSIGDLLTVVVAKFGIDSIFNTEIPWLDKLLNRSDK